MSEVRFDVSDVARIRFAVSPLWETIASLWALADPGRHTVHLPWLREVRPLSLDPELAGRTAPLRSLIGSGDCLPDFLTPPPGCSLGEIEEELAVVLATPAERVRAELTPADPTASSSFGRLLAADPERSLPILADAARAWWQAAIRPHWPRMRAVLEADIAYRTRQFSSGGVQLLVDRLHPAVRWSGDRLCSDDGLDTVIDLAGRGLPMLPSVFANRCVLLTNNPAAPPVAIYPARAVGTLWERQAGSTRELDRLLGRSRAAILAYTSSPSTTTQLAARTGLSLGAVSQHLTVLRSAGLVSSHRYRHEVNYTVSDLGVALLDRA